MSSPTYRQLDYWVRRGHLRVPPAEPNRAGNGSGIPREWPEAERRIAELMARLLDAGLQLSAAARCARAHVENPSETCVQLATDLYLLIPPGGTDAITRAAEVPAR